MLLFELIIGWNKTFRSRYEKLDNETQQQIIYFFVLIEGLILWTIGVYKIVKG